MLGGPGVGKTALLEQFATSDDVDAYDDKGEYYFFRVCYIVQNAWPHRVCCVSINGISMQASANVDYPIGDWEFINHICVRIG